MNKFGRHPACSRRLALSALGILPQLHGQAIAAGRTPYGGTLRTTCPWPLSQLDPHQANDAASLFFGHAVFNSLYGVTRIGTPFASLARRLPTATATGFDIDLRKGLISARGKPLDASAVRYSLERAHAAGAHPFARQLLRVRAPAATKIRLELRKGAVFSTTSVARWLASPLMAIVPKNFSATSPDGSGAFSAHIQRGKIDTLHLSRNTRAARGASYLSRITVNSTRDLAEPLRRFEAKQDDIGWLGRGLHSPRLDAQLSSSGALGWLVLRTGNALGLWSRPGIAFELAEAVAPEALRPLGVQAFCSGSGSGYRGQAASLLVAEGSPQLAAIAGSVAEALNADGRSRLEVQPISQPELEQRLRSRAFGFALTIERPLGLEPHGVLPTLHALAGSRSALQEHPPTPVRSAATRFCRTQDFTVLGTLHAQVGHTDDYAELSAWQLGEVFYQGASRREG